MLPQLNECHHIIVNIVLPYEALAEIPRYTRLLAHELYHYIAPPARRPRNVQMGILYVSFVISQILTGYLDGVINGVLASSFKKLIDDRCLHYAAGQYDQWIKYIDEYDSDSEWNTYYDKLKNVFSVKSVEFFKKDKLYSDIYNILKEAADVLVRSKSIAGIREDERQKIKEEFADEQELLDKFKEWLKQAGNRQEMVLADEVIYALREMAPDYFMIQLMDEKNRETEYYKLVLHYKELLKPYRKLIFLYLEGMKFESFTDEGFKSNLEQTREMLCNSSKNEFVRSVQYVERFQVQKNLAEMEGYMGYATWNGYDIIDVIRKKLDIEQTKPVSENNPNPLEKMYAQNVESLVRCIDMAAKQISDGTEPVWYRGHASVKYKLIPSLYRMKDDKELFYKGIELRSVMETMFKAFQVKAFGAKEIFEKGGDSLIGTLVSMQHYSVPTNILDWTPSAFTALYFAVEDYMAESEKDKRNRKKPEEAAEIWLLNPIRLNKAREFLTSRRIDSGILSDYPIPSIYGNEEEYKEYIPFSKQGQPCNVPVAVFVPHVNQRIKARLGTFTMFSLDDKGQVAEKGAGVKFADLYDFQKKCEVKYKADKAKYEYKPFLISVLVSKKCLIEAADWLKRMGVSKPNVYPELTNISKSLTGEIRDFCEKQEVK